MPAADTISRFSNRVADYVRSRPGYPPRVLEILREEAGLTPSSVIADIGSGTGLSSKLFLKNGNTVYSVEPNTDMRSAAETLLSNYPNFHSVAGSAAATTLPGRSVDMIVAGQAFHWFDVPKSRAEFERILRDRGPVVLMWNTPKEDASPFMRGYIQLLRDFGTDYKEVVHTNIKQEELRTFFGSSFKSHPLSNHQFFDREGLRSRLMSSSFVPAQGHPNHGPMMRALDDLFDSMNRDGQVQFMYQTDVYFGSLS